MEDEGDERNGHIYTGALARDFARQHNGDAIYHRVDSQQNGGSYYYNTNPTPSPSPSLFSLFKSERKSNMALREAARYKQLNRLRTILAKADVEVDATDKDGMGALHWACKNGHVDVLQILLNHGADPGRQANKSSYTPLMVAAQMGNTATMNALLDKGAPIDTVSRYDSRHVSLDANVLAVAIVHERLGAIEALMRRGADANSSFTIRWTWTNEPCSPLLLAINNWNFDCIVKLVEHGADVSETFAVLQLTAFFESVLPTDKAHNLASDPLQCAFHYDLLSLVIIRRLGVSAIYRLMQLGCNYNWDIQDRSLLPDWLCAILVNDGHMIEDICDNGMDPDAWWCGTTPLHHAADRGNVEILRMLLSRGANVHAKVTSDTADIEALSGVSRLAWVEHVNASTPWSLSDRGNTALHRSVCHDTALAYLLSKGAHIDALNPKEHIWPWQGRMPSICGNDFRCPRTHLLQAVVSSQWAVNF